MTKAMGVQWPGKKVKIHIGDIFLKKHHDAYFSVNFQVRAPREITHSPASPFWLLPTSSVNQREMLTASPEALKIGANFPSTAEKTQRPACRQSLYEAGDQGLSGTSRPSVAAWVPFFITLLRLRSAPWFTKSTFTIYRGGSEAINCKTLSFHVLPRK